MEAVPDDIEDETKFVPVPTRPAFGLGAPLVFAFVKLAIPEHDREISDIFSRRGACRRFKDFLSRNGKLNAWSKFEEQAQLEVVREWCKENGLEVED
jgi:hypothetical protein